VPEMVADLFFNLLPMGISEKATAACRRPCSAVLASLIVATIAAVARPAWRFGQSGSARAPARSGGARGQQ